MRDAVIVSVVRTPVAKIGQGLAGLEASNIAGMTMVKLLEQANIKPEAVDEVVYGNLFNYDNRNMARVAWLEAGLPHSVPAITIDRQCSSSLNAVAFASMLVGSGNCDVVLAGGVESYSKKPIMFKNPERPYPMTLELAPDQTSGPKSGNTPMIVTADNLAKKYSLTREECDAFAVNSHKKAAAAWERGFFAGETFPITIKGKKADVIFDKDECVRPDSSVEALARLRPIYPDGVTTAGNASPMNDGASAVLIMTSEKAAEFGLEPLVKIGAFASAGCDPTIMGIGPVHSTRKLLKQTGLTIDDFDLVEINEAFAAQSLACIKELGIDMSRVNPNGGAIAIGHPNAASGGILTARAARHMNEQKLNRGLITFCCGGGQGFSLMLEKI